MDSKTILLGVIYIIVLLFFFSIIFKVLRASRLEECFKQGHIFEIRVAYVVISLIISYLLCEMVDKFLSIYGLSL